MNGLFDADAAQYCLQIMEKLDEARLSAQKLEEVLADLCQHFQFSCGFVYYQSDYKSSYVGQAVNLAPNQFCLLPDILELDNAWGQEFLSALAERKIVTCLEREPETQLERKIGSLLGLSGYVLVPAIGEDRRVIAMIGLGGICGERLEDINFSAIYSILVIVLNHMKSWHYAISIERTQKALESIANNMGVDIYVNDFNNHDVLYVNQSMAAPYGGAGQMIGQKCWKVLYDDKTGQCEYCPQKKLTDRNGKPTKVYSWDYQRPFDKSWFRVLSVAFRWEDGRLAHIVSSIDITDHKKKEEVIRKIADYDTLTGLSNRGKLFHDGNLYLRLCAVAGNPLYVLFFDLNKFKQVNDLYGHRAGDELLRLAGQYLKTNEDTRDFTYRYGGDEFVLLFPQHTKSAVLEIAETIKARFEQPWELKSCHAVCQASIGIAEYPRDGADMDELLQAADQAMYEAKSLAGEKIVIYEGNKTGSMN